MIENIKEKLYHEDDNYLMMMYSKQDLDAIV